MPDLNKVMLMGNLTRDPEVRYTPKGTAVGDLAMAINMSYKTAEGQTKDEVCYVDVVAWGRQAETCKEYLSKGSPIFVEGRLQLDQWETKEGEKKSRLRVRAERVQFLSGGQRRGGSTGGSSSGGRSEAPARYGSGGDDHAAPSGGPSHGHDADPGPPADDDIPF